MTTKEMSERIADGVESGQIDGEAPVLAVVRRGETDEYLPVVSLVKDKEKGGLLLIVGKE